jgi:hypothetical protein
MCEERMHMLKVHLKGYRYRTFSNDDQEENLPWQSARSPSVLRNISASGPATFTGKARIYEGLAHEIIEHVFGHKKHFFWS